MKQHILIDGENFVHGLVHILRSQKLIRSRSQLSRISIHSLFDSLLASKDASIVYYSTRVQVPPSTSELHQAVEKMRQWNAKWTPYLANQGVSFVKAGILKARNSKRCSHCGERTEILLEKGVDVRLGVDIVAYAKKDAVIYLFSSDSDLLPAIRAARENGARVVYVAFEGSQNHAMSRTSSQTVIIKKSMVKKAFKEAQK